MKNSLYKSTNSTIPQNYSPSYSSKYQQQQQTYRYQSANQANYMMPQRPLSQQVVYPNQQPQSYYNPAPYHHPPVYNYPNYSAPPAMVPPGNYHPTPYHPIQPQPQQQQQHHQDRINKLLEQEKYLRSQILSNQNISSSITSANQYKTADLPLSVQEQKSYHHITPFPIDTSNNELNKQMEQAKKKAYADELRKQIEDKRKRHQELMHQDRLAPSSTTLYTNNHQSIPSISQAAVVSNTLSSRDVSLDKREQAHHPLTTQYKYYKQQNESSGLFKGFSNDDTLKQQRMEKQANILRQQIEERAKAKALKKITRRRRYT